MKQCDEDVKKKKNVSLKISLSTMDDEIDEEEEEKLAILTRMFYWFVNSVKGGKRNFKKVRDELSKQEIGEHIKRVPITCYKSKKSSHIQI